MSGPINSSESHYPYNPFTASILIYSLTELAQALEELYSGIGGAIFFPEITSKYASPAFDVASKLSFWPPAQPQLWGRGGPVRI